MLSAGVPVFSMPAALTAGVVGVPKRRALVGVKTGSSCFLVNVFVVVGVLVLGASQVIDSD